MPHRVLESCQPSAVPGCDTPVSAADVVRNPDTRLPGSLGSCPGTGQDGARHMPGDGGGGSPGQDEGVRRRDDGVAGVVNGLVFHEL